MLSTTKPEVVVTTDKMSAFLPLLPAPTPTRFLGKLQLLKEENNKKKNILEISKNVSRRSSLAPVLDTEEGNLTPEKQGPKGGFKKYDIFFVRQFGK